MKKTTDDGGMFVCAYREKKVKAFVSSCGTTRLNDQRTFRNSDVQTSTAQRPEVVGEYETHKSSIIDAANNLRDNKISYHDIISTDRWEMHYFGFFLGICEANAFSAYRVFRDGSNTNHSAFKDSLTWSFLRHCKSLNNDIMEPALPAAIPRAARSCNCHNYVKITRANDPSKAHQFGMSRLRVKRFQPHKSGEMLQLRPRQAIVRKLS